MLVRADDILVSGRTDKEHLANIDEVLSRLAKAGLKAKRKKCRVMEPKVVYMGYILDSRGHRLNHYSSAKGPCPKQPSRAAKLPWHAELP